MDANKIIEQYFDAWNQLDVAGLLALFHPGAAFYDAFWMETCIGRDLAQYFRDSMQEEPLWFQQLGEAIRTETGVISRYTAHERLGLEIGEPKIYGAEIFTILDGKILTVTDIYCDPDQEALEEVANLAAMRHGLPSHANSGLGAMKAARIRTKLSDRMEGDKVFLDPNITVSELAEMIGCTMEQLSTVIETQLGMNPGNFVDTRRVQYARTLLSFNQDRACDLEEVATKAGFKSVAEFTQKFSRIVGVTPADYCGQHTPTDDSHGNSSLH